jgi:hypothetical protein
LGYIIGVSVEIYYYYYVLEGGTTKQVI